MILRSTKLYQSPIASKVLELLLDITFLIDPSKHALLKRLKDHIDINNKLRRTDRNGKVEKGQKETEQRNEELSDTESQTLDLMLLTFLSYVLQLNLYECNAQTGANCRIGILFRHA